MTGALPATQINIFIHTDFPNRLYLTIACPIGVKMKMSTKGVMMMMR